MHTKRMDGNDYMHMLHGGVAMLAAHTEELNALNVFPVSDGDTGTNMLKTMEGGLAELGKDTIQSIGTVSKLFARGALLGARGNSGVILSQIFAGIQQGLEDCECVNALQFAKAYQNGIAKSYAAVQNPTEGTILTVFRESTEYAAANITEDATIEDFFRLHIEEASRSLAATKEILPVLAEADVVDSGAAGYLCIAEGMYKALSGEELSYAPLESKEKKGVNIDLFTRDSVPEYGYCTEFLLRLTNAKVDPDTFDIKRVLSVLEALGGESIVAYQQEDIVKVHVHTFHPGEVLAGVHAFGEFLTVKVENMTLEHSQTHQPNVQNEKPFSVVAVATGEGMSALFSQMGADYIISGGQTANPSIEEFVEAFRHCHTDHIIVLPNNKNIILAAQQAAALYQGATVHIVESKNMMQGYSALSVVTPGITDMEALVSSAQRAAQSVTDGEITKAVRDANLDGQKIKRGDYIAISEGKILAVGASAEEAVFQMLNNIDTDLCEIITLFVGKDVSAEKRTWITEQLQERYDQCEVVVYEGGQEIYDYFLAIE